MARKNPDNPFPDDNPRFADVSSEEDENEVTVILPEVLTEEVGSEVTEEVPGLESDGSKTGEVFVLLPDGDDSQIPMVETQEVPEITEEIDGPRLASVYESATASHIGLRRENPLQARSQAADTEIDPYGTATEEVMVTDHPTETMSAGDLDDFANEVADDMLVAEGGAPSRGRGSLDYDEDFGGDDEPAYDDEESAYAPRRRTRSSPFKKVALSLVALVAIAATGVHFFPESLGLDPSFDLKEFVTGHVNSLIGGPEVANSGGSVPPTPAGGGDSGGTGAGTPTPPPLAMAAQETFKSKFKQAIELGFGEVPR